VDLVTFGDLNVLETVSTVNTDFTVFATGKHNRRVPREADGGLGDVELVTLGILIEMGEDGGENVTFQVPNFDTAIVGD